MVAAVLQLVLLLAPLTEFSAAANAATTVAAGSQLISPGHHGARAHDEATCPACIARTLHARLESLAPPPVLATSERAPLNAAAAVARPSKRHPAHPSRAPPVIA